ncbi:MAG: anthranilate synthase component I family protein [Chitinophagales bacterium]
MSESTSFIVADVANFKRKALAWANQFRVCALLDANQYTSDPYSELEWILAVDVIEECAADKDSFNELHHFLQRQTAPVFGYFSYDIKNQIEALQSKPASGIAFPDLYWFRPRYQITINKNEVTINRNYPETFDLRQQIEQFPIPEATSSGNILLSPRTSREKYLQQVENLREKIAAGDFYEINYCCEFFCEGQSISPLAVFEKLNNNARAPFGVFFKWNQQYLLCASPERFLKKKNQQVISQPIKGTAKISSDKEENESLKKQLQHDEKERSENVMIVDLVRNDLARIAIPGTVEVPELFGVYQFNTVHQMISTVTATMDAAFRLVDVIRAAFPMGSMTGAPKVAAMQQIDAMEDQPRGIYSGSFGYITPEGDFDLNVIIRSILYNAQKPYLSVLAGGAITYDSVPEKEFEEIQLKINALRQALQQE